MFARRLTILALVALAAGCTTRTVALEPEAAVVTASTAERVADEGVARDDVEIINERVVAASSGPVTAFRAPIEWENARTGTSGAITAIDRYMGRHGQTCRSFKTTVMTYLGIAIYDGETCQVKERHWALSWLRKAD